MKNPLRIFQKIVTGYHVNDSRLGCPAGDSAAVLRRLNYMATLRNGSGFRVPPEEPKTRGNFDGRTRGEEKRRLRALANAAETERQQKAADRLVSLGLPRKEAEAGFGSLQGAR